MLLVRRTTVYTTLIVVLLVKQAVLADDIARSHADESGRYAAQRDRCLTLPANMTLCRGVGYRSVRLPNLFGHETLIEATQQADDWVLLVNIHCHPDTQVSFLLRTRTCGPRDMTPSLYRPVTLNVDILTSKLLLQLPLP